ncbi:MAG TPA: DNA polymerase III subunit gamma and tau [Mycobacteriales bacterium]|nr:DNA polymerase III subunit gamma and tau [Mycobacteriales bacterium]
MALYRKYRPGSFAEVVGQEHVTEPISQALDTGRVHHAYLFSGPRGCGKTSSARILARSLNCEKGPTSTPCGVCDSCVALAPNGPGSLDVIEIDAASHGLVDDARDLRERAFFAPVSSRFKVYIVDEAHMITSAAFNALLKVVEEPPPHVKFVFATTEPDKVLTTIKSRTFHYRFRLIPPQLMREHLAELCGREGIDVDPLVLPLVVRAAAGSVRDAQSLLDQLAGGSGGERITYDRAAALLGYTDASLLDEVVDAFVAADGAAVFGAVDRVIEAGLDPRRFAQDLLERFRDLLVLDAVPTAAETGLLDLPGDQLERMQAQAMHYGRASLSRAADAMAAALVEMRGTTSPRLVLELACARILLPAAATDAASMLARLERLERRLSVTPPAETPPADAPPADAPPADAPTAPPDPASPEPASPDDHERIRTKSGEIRETAHDHREGESAGIAGIAGIAGGAGGAASGGPLDLAGLRRIWNDVLDAVKTRSRTANALMFSAQLESLEKNVVTLSFKTPSLAARFAGDVEQAVAAALHEVAGFDLKLRATTSESGSAGDANPRRQSPGRGKRGAVEELDAAEVAESEPVADAPADQQKAALSLLQEGLGAQVIGEIETD